MISRSYWPSTRVAIHPSRAPTSTPAARRENPPTSNVERPLHLTWFGWSCWWAGLHGGPPGTRGGRPAGVDGHRVLGQYDLLIIEDEAPEDQDLVYYVGPNVLALEKRFGFPPREFRLWLALHEVTHRAQFTGVPWLPRPLPVARPTRRSTPSTPTPSGSSMPPAGVIDDTADPAQPARRGRHRHPAGEPRPARAVRPHRRAMSLLEGHGDVTMDRAGEGHVRRRRPVPPGAARAAEPGRHRGEVLQKVSASTPSSSSTRRASHSSPTSRATAAPTPSTPPGGGPGGCRPWPRSGPQEWLDRVRLSEELVGDRGRSRPGPGDTSGADVEPRTRRRGLRPAARPRPPRRCDFPPAGTAVTYVVSGGAAAGAAGAGRRGGLPGDRHPRRPGPRPGFDRRGRGRAGAAGRLVPSSAPSGCGGPRAQRGGPGPGRPLHGPPTRRAHRPHGRRPGRDRAAQPAAGRGPRRARRHGSRPAPAAPTAPPRDPVAVRHARPRSGGRPQPTAIPCYRRNRVRHELLPLLDAIAERDVVPVLARQADLARADTSLLDELAAALDPPMPGRSPPAPPPLARPRRALPGSRRRARRTRTSPARRPRPRRRCGRRPGRSRGLWSCPEAGGWPKPADASASRLRPGRFCSACRPIPRRRPHRTEPAVPARPPTGSSTISTTGPSATSWSARTRSRTRIAELGAQITADYADDPPLLVVRPQGCVRVHGRPGPCHPTCRSRSTSWPCLSWYGTSTRSSRRRPHRGRTSTSTCPAGG